MKKNLAIFFLTYSFAIVLVHSILPHDHLKDQSLTLEIATVKSPSLVDLIKRSLTHDLGSKHLEEYKHSGISYNIDHVYTEICEVIDDANLEDYVNYDNVITQPASFQYLPNTGLRAPPYRS